jgi:hypothetical protein
MPEFAGFVHTAAGAGNNGLTINLYARNDHAGSTVATTTRTLTVTSRSLTALRDVTTLR